MYFKFFKLHSWGKRSGDHRRRLIQRLLYGKNQNPKLLTFKMLCDGLEITPGEFFSTAEFAAPEPEIRLENALLRMQGRLLFVAGFAMMWAKTQEKRMKNVLRRSYQ